MNKTEVVEYWTAKAKDELDSARVMFDAGRYMYTGFMCHQSIEKIMKAYYIYLNDEMHPQTHSLHSLAVKTNLDGRLQPEQKDTLKKLDPLYIKTRYEDYKNDISSLLTNDYCGILLKETEELCLWIIGLMK